MPIEDLELTLSDRVGSCDANDAVQVTIVQPDQQKPKTLASFHPQFTYPIFGDEEQIFGYKGLIIRLRFAAHNLRPHAHVSYDDKFTAVEDAEPVDISKALEEFLPEGTASLEQLLPCNAVSDSLKSRGLFVTPRLRERCSGRRCKRLCATGQACSQLFASRAELRDLGGFSGGPASARASEPFPDHGIFLHRGWDPYHNR